MTVDQRLKYLDNVRALASLVLSPIRQLVNSPFALSSWALENMSQRESLLEENNSLRAQQLILRAQLQKLDAIQVENIRLRRLLNSASRVSDKMLVAEIIKADMDPFTRQIVLNKGSMNDVYAGQAVIDAEGILGQIIRVDPLSSIVMLITDPSASTPVQVNRNGFRAIVSGTGATDKLELNPISTSTDIRMGDLLVTSGLGGRYPPNYPVARVIKVEPDPSRAHLKVSVEPLARIEQIREVLLVTPRDPQQETSDTGSTENKETSQPITPAAIGTTSETAPTAIGIKPTPSTTNPTPGTP